MAASLAAASRANELLAAAYEEEEALCPELLPGVRDRASSQRERWAEVSPRLAELAPLPANAAPIIIAGLQRTGTTLLHNLLALQPALIAPPLYRLAYVCEGVDDERAIQRTQASLDSMHKKLPIMNDQHPVSATGPEECCYLLDIVGVDRNAILTARHMEAYMTWLYALPDAPDTLASLLYAHSCLFRAAAGRDNGTPLFKDIFHMLFLDAILDLYPDAVIVHPYRKAEDIVLSACDAYSSLAQLHWPEMTQDIRHSMGARVLRLFTECMRRFCDTVERRGLLRSQRFVLVPYTTLVAEPLAVVRRVCEARGLELSAQVEEQILHCAQRPHKGRYAQLCCYVAGSSTLADYGLTRTAPLAAFERYAKLIGYDP